MTTITRASCATPRAGASVQAPGQNQPVPARDVIELVAIVLAAGLASDVVAGVLRVPRMVVLLGAGALLGPHVLESIEMPLDSVGVQLLFTLGVSLILFYGGLGLSVAVLQPVAVGLVALAVPGVVISALLTGLVAAAAFDVPLEVGFLIGAVLAPTDPAILVPLFERMRIRPKVVQTVIAESALNDPTGAVLALATAAYVLEGGGSFAGPLDDFLVDLGISTALGVAFGILLALAISHLRVGLWRDSGPIAVLLVIAGGFFTIDSAGGSGYLGAFIAGLIVGNMNRLRLGLPGTRESEMRFFAAFAADVMVIFIFVALGANLPFDRMGDHALPALAVLAALIFVARPVTVLAALGIDRRGRWNRNELLFVAWTRETGVVPAAVAGVLVAQGVPSQNELLTVVALAVIVTLVLQATTKAWLAGRLGLTEPGATPIDPAV
jgi:cell volume regulation protein A